MPTPVFTPTADLKVTDRSVSFTLPGIGVRITNSYDGGGQGAMYVTDISEEGISLIVAHSAATDTYRGTYGADTIEGVPTRTVTGDFPLASYQISATSNPLATPVSSSYDAYEVITFNKDSEYSQLFSFQKQIPQEGLSSQAVFPMIFFGSNTAPGDLPSQATNTYSGSSVCAIRQDNGTLCNDVSVARVTPPDASANISIDWSTGMVTAATTVLPQQRVLTGGRPIYTIDVDAKVDRATGRIRGTATASGYTGSVIGQFYGPQAREVGMIALLTRPSTRSILIVAIGGRR